MILDILSELGVERLRQRGDEVTGLCPLHEERTGSVDHKPSWSMNTNPPYPHLCFSCGYKGTILGLYRDLGMEPPENLREQMLVVSLDSYRNHAETKSSENRLRSLQNHPSYAPVGDTEPDPEIVSVPQRLADRRRLKADTLDRYEIRWNTSTKCWVIPLHDPEGELVGAQVKQAGAVYTLPKNLEKSHLLFGHHRNVRNKFTAVVESPLDVLRLHQADVQAVATMGSYVSDEQLELLNQYIGIVACGDNDTAGEKMTDFLFNKLSRNGRAVFRANYEDYPYGDPGDFPNDTELALFMTASCPFL